MVPNIIPTFLATVFKDINVPRNSGTWSRVRVSPETKPPPATNAQGSAIITGNHHRLELKMTAANTPSTRQRYVTDFFGPSALTILPTERLPAADDNPISGMRREAKD